MRLRSVNLGIALTLSLAATAKAEDRSFMPILDDTAYEAVMAAIGSTDAAKAEDRPFMAVLDDTAYEASTAAIGSTDIAKLQDRPFMPPLDDTSSYEAILAAMGSTNIDAPFAAEDWGHQAMDFGAASEATGAIPTDPERHMGLSAQPALDVPVPADPAHDLGAAAFYPDAVSILDITEAEPLPLQAISSFDLTLTADDMPTAPIWDTI